MPLCKTLVLFIITVTASITAIQNQVYAVPTLEEIRTDGATGSIICSDSSEYDGRIDGHLHRGYAFYYDEGDENYPVRYYDNFARAGLYVNVLDRDGLIIDTRGIDISVARWQITGEPPNLRFSIQGKAIADTICNGDVPVDVTISGTCSQQQGSTGRAVYQSANGQWAEFTISGGAYHLCLVCPPESIGYHETDSGAAGDCAAEELIFPSQTMVESGASSKGENPSDVDSSIGHVKPGDNPPLDGTTLTETEDTPQIEEGKTTDDKQQTEPDDTSK